jgi:hypothetical protein
MAKKTTRTKAAPKKTAKKKAAKTATKRAARRPNPNQPPTSTQIDAMTKTLMDIIAEIDAHAANLRALDRQRHNGVGLKRFGFIEETFRLSKQFPQYYPHWLDAVKFQRDITLFNSVKSLVDACRSLEEKAWNINVESSDMIYTNALEYYSQVQDAAKRRVDSAETLYEELNGFFHRGSYKSDVPTEKKAKRDINALMHGKKDGEIIIRNISPKTTGGTHEIIDRTYRDTAEFKETDEGRITE